MISSCFFVFIRGVYSWIIPSILEETFNEDIVVENWSKWREEAFG